MMESIHLTPSLKSIKGRSELVTSIQKTLQEAFGPELPSLRGNIQLVTEILISIESMKYGLDSQDQKDALFLQVYRSVFGGDCSEIELSMLSQICTYLRETGAVYRRTRFGNLVRAILRVFRA